MLYRSAAHGQWLRQSLLNSTSRRRFSSSLWRTLNSPGDDRPCLHPHRAVVVVAAATACTNPVRCCHSQEQAHQHQHQQSAPSSSAAPPKATAMRDRFVCLECGKQFLCSANLLQHRTARHGLRTVTPQEAARTALMAHNAELQRELSHLRARVKQLREEKQSDAVAATTATTTTTSSTNGTTPAVTKTYPSAVLTGKVMEVDAVLEKEWRQSGLALGTGVSFIDCVGTVRGPVQIGALAGAAAAAEAAPRVLQFTVEAHGYRERRPGQLKMYRAHLLVRHIPSQPYYTVSAGTTPSSCSGSVEAAFFSVREGDVVRVQGHYGLHHSYDMISKLPVENVVVEADFVGLLRAAAEGEATGQAPVTSASAASAAHMAEVEMDASLKVAPLTCPAGARGGDVVQGRLTSPATTPAASSSPSSSAARSPRKTTIAKKKMHKKQQSRRKGKGR